MSLRTEPPGAEALWHDCECGGYEADLEVWRDLAARAPCGPLVELGAGSGRVSLDLALRGYSVHAVERDEDLVSELRRRARDTGHELSVGQGCAWRACVPGGRAGSVLATMQFLQLSSSRDEMRRLIQRWARFLVPGGTFAAAIVDGDPREAVGDPGEALPDVREIDGWVAQSTPVVARRRNGRLEVERRRELVSPIGERRAERSVSSLIIVEAQEVEEMLRLAGLGVLPRVVVAPTLDHVASTVVIGEAEHA